MNLKIKFRESFRPFAPSVLKEEASRWFDVPDGYESPYMLLVADVAKEQRLAQEEGVGNLAGNEDVSDYRQHGRDAHATSIRRPGAFPGKSGTADDGETGGVDRLLKVVRSTIPAVTHVDNSARLQTVDEERHGRFYRLLRHFHEKTGCPVVINTSFNVRGEPIVCSPADAWRCFMATNMDALVLEDCLLLKTDQPAAVAHDVDEYLAKRELD